MTACPIRYQRQVSDRKGKIFYTSITSLSHISKYCRIVKGFEEVWTHFRPSKPCLPLLTDTIVYTPKCQFCPSKDRLILHLVSPLSAKRILHSAKYSAL